MFVTSIYKLDKKKSLILLDEDIKISLYNSELYKYEIQEQSELSDETSREIFEILLPRRARERVFYMLKDSDRSEQDVRRKLLSSYYPQDIVETVIRYMKDMKYIDDKRYAENYIRSNRKQKSINRMKQELYFHGVDKSIVCEAVDSFEDEWDLLSEEQQNIIQKEFIRRKYDFQGEDERMKNKIIQSLMRKGFHFDDIQSVYRKLKEESET